jgi:hypothetical protein
MSHIADPSADADSARRLVEPPVADLDRRPYGDRAVVLAEATDEEMFATTPTVVCCPNCAEVITTYETGLPAAIPQFDEECATCDVELRRWSVVAVDAAYHELVDTSGLTELTQAYWRGRLQAGITNARDDVRNDEYEELFSKMASLFGWDWERICPLCRTPQDRFDYHHWTETPDQGVVLCRECHDVIGFDMPDFEVEERVHKWGMSSRNDLQVLRLALREAIVTDRTLQPAMATQLIERYNLIQTSAEVKALLEALCREEQLYDQVVDEDLWNSFE